MSTLTSTAQQILIIEDNKTNRELMVYLLNAFGYSTSEAVNGRTGVEIARKGHPQLVVCDIQVPELDGYGIIRELKTDETLREIPVVAVTALAMVGDRDRILAAGFDGYIPKPIAPETFVAELEKFLPAGKRAVNHEVVVTPESAPTPAVLPGARDKSATTQSSRVDIAVDDLPETRELCRNTLQP